MRTATYRPLSGGVILSWAFYLTVWVSAGAQTSSPPYCFTTLAGVASVGSADGPGSDARFNFPTGLSLDTAGNLYVADSLNYTVRRITPAGLVSTVAGRAGESRDVEGPGSSARFRNVQAVAADRQGNVFVAEGRVIRRIAPDGMVTTLAGYLGDGYVPPSSVDGTGPLARFNSLTGLVVDAGGTLFASDGGGNTIRRITPEGVVTTLAGSGLRGAEDGVGLAAGFSGPVGLAVDSGGAVYVADSGNHTIRKILAGGTVTTLAGRASNSGFADGVGTGALFHAPHGVAVDAGGKVYVADYFNEAIRGVTPAGQVTTLAGRPPANGNPAQVGSIDGTGGAAAFNSPSGLVADPAGNLYVADAGNNTIRKVTPAGLVTTVAGFPADQAVGAADGIGTAARFSIPAGIAVTPDGTCYVADAGNHVIRKISPEGVVTTLAGLAGEAGYADGAGAAARFNSPGGLAIDAAGNLFVIEGDNSTVRKITPAGVVSTVAGVGGTSGLSIDGLGPVNGYSRTTCIAVGPDGLVYVGEMGLIFHPEHFYYEYFQRVRKVTAAGQVSTEWQGSDSHARLTGLAVAPDGTIYFCDPVYQSVYRVTPGRPPERQFLSSFAPLSLALDPSARVILTEAEGYTGARVARLTPGGVLEILGGGVPRRGNLDGLGSEAGFAGLSGIAVDAAGSVYLACSNHTIRKGVIAVAPAIITQPQGRTVAVGGGVQFAVAAAAVPEPAYQWYFNGAAINGATAASYGFAAARTSDAGEYSVVVTNALGSVTSAKAVLTVTGGNTTPPSSSDGGSGGGGGAPSGWFLGGLALLAAARLGRRWSARAGAQPGF